MKHQSGERWNVKPTNKIYIPTPSSGVCRHDSSRIWIAALSWAAIKAFFNSSLSPSLVKPPMVNTVDGTLVTGPSNKCRLNWLREAAKDDCKTLITMLKTGAHLLKLSKLWIIMPTNVAVDSEELLQSIAEANSAWNFSKIWVHPKSGSYLQFLSQGTNSSEISRW